MLNIDIIPCLQDNYSFVVHDAETDTVGFGNVIRQLEVQLGT